MPLPKTNALKKTTMYGAVTYWTTLHFSIINDNVDSKISNKKMSILVILIV